MTSRSASNTSPIQHDILLPERERESVFQQYLLMGSTVVLTKRYYVLIKLYNLLTILRHWMLFFIENNIQAERRKPNAFLKCLHLCSCNKLIVSYTIPVWYIKRKKEEYIREDTYCHRNCMYKQWCNFIENHLSKVMKKNRIARFFLIVYFFNIHIDMQLQAHFIYVHNTGYVFSIV